MKIIPHRSIVSYLLKWVLSINTKVIVYVLMGKKCNLKLTWAQEFRSKSKKSIWTWVSSSSRQHWQPCRRDVTHFPDYASETSVQSTNPPSEKVWATVWTKLNHWCLSPGIEQLAKLKSLCTKELTWLVFKINYWGWTQKLISTV